MLITVEEYYEMGFTAPDDDTALRSVKRASYIISAITDGRADSAITEGGTDCEYIKQAVGFQAQLLAGAAADSAADTEDTVSLGDFSYKQKISAQQTASVVQDTPHSHIIGLLRAAGVMYRGVNAR